MQMRVGIDISAIQYGRGISRYTSNLVRALHAKKTDVALKMFGTSLRQREALQQFVDKETPGAFARIFPQPTKIMEVVWNRFHTFSPELFLGELDVFHSWEMQPPLKKAALVSTIHDLAMLRYPETANAYVLQMNQASWKHLKKEAKAIIAVSHSTKKDIVELLQIEPSRVHVVHEALPEEARLSLTTVRRNELLAKLGVNKKPYLLFVGTLEPRKNVPRLIRAWEPLKKNFDLVLAGNAGWETIKRQAGLHLFHSFTQEELVALYQGSAAVTYPSLYEGFGLPILEGFYHHVPVVTSDNSGMAEVAGDAAILVDPFNDEAVRVGIEKAIKYRDEFVKKGNARLKQFSWDKVADETIAVYRKAMKK